VHECDVRVSKKSAFAFAIAVLSATVAGCGTGGGPTSPSAPSSVSRINAERSNPAPAAVPLESFAPSQGSDGAGDVEKRAALQPVSRGDLAVTEGSVETSNGRLMIDVPEMRAVLRVPTTQSIEVNFTYLGPTEITATLGNGEVRHQFGLKLRAQDACNLLYVMWEAAPASNLAVSMKHNPGMRSSSQCRDGGYDSLQPARSKRSPELRSGSAHTLRADINNQDLQVRIDGELTWEGRIPSAAMSFDGPVGLRSDNARVVFDALVAR
jgi:hypothetical protein